MRAKARSSSRSRSSSTISATTTRAIRLSETFMKQVVANLDNDWTLRSDEIDAFLSSSDKL